MYFLKEKINFQSFFSTVSYHIKKVFLPKWSILFVPTFKCNYNCPYCNVTKEKLGSIYKEINWRKWRKFFENIPPATVSISGGEPFLYKRIVRLVNSLKKHKVHIVTNLSMLRKIKKINRSIRFTVSFHPHMISLSAFKEKIIKLQRWGFSFQINIVAYPDIIDSLKFFKEVFENMGIHVNVDPYIDPSFTYSREELLKIKKFVRNRVTNFYANEGRKKKCNAGRKYFVIVPNGDVFACSLGFASYVSPRYKKFFKKEFFLGNAFSSFKILKKNRICFLPCASGCDLDLAKVKIYS